MDARSHLGVRGLIVAAAALLTMVAPLRAQDEMALSLFTPAEGTLAPGQEDRWTFAAANDVMLSFQVRAAGELDPVIAIENSAGNVIMQNDDYGAAESRDALLEGVTIPDTGFYTAVVSGFSDTAGDYELTMLPGFAAVALRETFEDPALWSVDSESVEAVFGNNRMALIVPGAAGRTLATYPEAEAQAERYIRVEIPEISGSAGSQVGLVTQYQDDGSYYLYALNQLGQWRFTVNSGGDEQVIRDWSTHPAIIPGQIEFSLGLMVRETGFEFFYNDQLIGRSTDATLAGPGLIGVMAQPSSGAENDMIAQFQNLAVTVPMDDVPIAPDRVASGDSTVTLQELQRRRLIPMIGEFDLIVPTSFVTYNRPGVNRILLGGSQQFGNFALGSTVTWEIATPSIPAGCGLVLDATTDEDYLLAYVDQTGAAGLSQRQGDTFVPGIFREGLPVDSLTHRLLVVADDDRLLYYVDGQLAGAVDREVGAGGVGNAVVNFEPTTTSCQFTDTWVWTWD